MQSIPSDTESGASCPFYFQPTLPPNPAIAMAYIPFQQYRSDQIYDPMEGLQQGTLFPELDLPFLGKEVIFR